MRRLSNSDILKRALTTAVVAAAVGCYSAIPIGMEVPLPETRVIASVTDIGAERMAPQIGVAASEVEGTVTAATDSLWQIRLIRVDQRGGVSTLWNGESVSFPRAALTNVRVKRLDKKRSWMLAGVIAVSAVVIQHVAALLGVGEDVRNPPVVPPA